MIANVWHALNLVIILLLGYYCVYREAQFRCKLDNEHFIVDVSHSNIPIYQIILCYVPTRLDLC